MWPLIERTIRKSRAAYIDLRLFLTGKSDPDLPPLRLRDIGGGDFRATGQHLLDITKRFGLIHSASRVLDIGCGSGRLALPLTEFLRHGRYAGFDVSKEAIGWCTKHISTRYPNFRFLHAALRNSDYSVRGRSAASFVFPFPAGDFDCAVAFSVFTHLRFEETTNYLAQIHRVLATGGRAVLTFFLLDEWIGTGHGSMQFPHADGPVRYASEKNPAFAVAIEESTLLERMREIGFSNVTVHRGGWSGIEGAPTFQDLVVGTKT